MGCGKQVTSSGSALTGHSAHALTSNNFQAIAVNTPGPLEDEQVKGR